jgi:hypothetical protein
MQDFDFCCLSTDGYSGRVISVLEHCQVVHYILTGTYYFEDLEVRETLSN